MSWFTLFIIIALSLGLVFGFVKVRSFFKTETQKERERKGPERIRHAYLRVRQKAAAEQVSEQVSRFIRQNTQLRNAEPERFDDGRIEAIKSDETNGATALTIWLQTVTGPNVMLASIAFDYTVAGAEIVARYGDPETPYTYTMDEHDKLIRLLENFLPAYGYEEAPPPPRRLVAASATA